MPRAAAEPITIGLQTAHGKSRFLLACQGMVALPGVVPDPAVTSDVGNRHTSETRLPAAATSATPTGGRLRGRSFPEKRRRRLPSIASKSHNKAASEDIELQACTIWLGRVPIWLANEAKLREVLVAEFGDKIKTITLRVKESNGEANQPVFSWAFVTFKDPDTMAVALERHSITTKDDSGAEAELVLSAVNEHGAATRGRFGTSRVLAHRHKARGRWRAAGVTDAKTTAARAGAAMGLMALWEERHQRQQAEHRRCFLLPHSSMRIAWDALRIIVLLYVAIVYPLRHAMDIYPGFGEPTFWLEALVDLFFIVDIVLEFRTAYTGDDGRLVVDIKLIARRYLRGWFICDIVSSLPIHYLVMLSMEDNGADSSSKGLKLLKVLRLA